MSKDRKGLVSLIDDLMQDREVLARFNRNPRKVAKDYDLGSIQKAALFRMDPDGIGRAISLDLATHAAAMDPSEWPREGPDYYPLPGDPEPAYPTPTPAAFRFLPTTIALPSPAGPPPIPTTFELSVFGQSFMHGNTRIEIRPVGGGANLAVSEFKMFGTFRCSGVKGLVTFPPATGLDQTFDVFVLSPATPQLPLFPTANELRVSATSVLTIKPS